MEEKANSLEVKVEVLLTVIVTWLNGIFRRLNRPRPLDIQTSARV
jgi:hypothetical protein